jgi:hypothetical protein
VASLPGCYWCQWRPYKVLGSVGSEIDWYSQLGSGVQCGVPWAEPLVEMDPPSNKPGGG